MHFAGFLDNPPNIVSVFLKGQRAAMIWVQLSLDGIPPGAEFAQVYFGEGRGLVGEIAGLRRGHLLIV